MSRNHWFDGKMMHWQMIDIHCGKVLRKWKKNSDRPSPPRLIASWRHVQVITSPNNYQELKTMYMSRIIKWIWHDNMSITWWYEYCMIMRRPHDRQSRGMFLNYYCLFTTTAFKIHLLFASNSSAISSSSSESTFDSRSWRFDFSRPLFLPPIFTLFFDGGNRIQKFWCCKNQLIL